MSIKTLNLSKIARTEGREQPTIWLKFLIKISLLERSVYQFNRGLSIGAPSDSVNCRVLVIEYAAMLVDLE